MTTWTNRIAQPQRECSGSLLSSAVGPRYRWQSKYTISADDSTCTLTVTVRICLKYDGDVERRGELQQRWKAAIERLWSRRYTLDKVGGNAPCQSFTVVFNVQFVSGNCDHEVNVKHDEDPAVYDPDEDRADVENWSDSTTGESAAHEFGHMLGLRDEYPDEKCPRRSIPNETPPSIMQDSANGEVKRRHYKHLADWLSEKTGSTYRPR